MVGESAVVFFFLLSSFVLCQSIDREGTGVEGIPAYYVKRFFRIYPAVLVAVLLSAVVALLYRQIPDLGDATPWFREQVAKARSVSGLWAYLMNALLLDRRLDPPLWTIIIELMGSFLLPWLMLLPRRKPHFLLVVGAVLVCFAYRSDGSTRFWVAPLFAFYIGYLIHLVEPFFRPPAPSRMILLLVIGIVSWLLSIRDHFNYITESVILGGILLLLIPCNWPRLLDLLNGAALHFLGMISFSFYLINLPLLLLSYAVLGHLVPKILVMQPSVIPAMALFILSIVVTVPIAAIFRLFVELPFNRAGHFLARRYFSTS
jgi:peptidoglycan/LPS O-acetylase OafA/YrhL